tara:strand:- start:3277 stop:3885 length:609 start_codon:yes stop_codon:yes gene_type:complete
MIISIAPPVNEEKLKVYIAWVERNGLGYKILTEEDAEIVGALLLCGGADVGTVPKRDKFERMLIDQALSMDLPILGICRGMQLVNWHLGGVVEDIMEKHERTHAIDNSVINEDTSRKESAYHKVYSICDDVNFKVNSRHHQHCSILSVELEPELYSEWDSVIECAIGNKIMLVQWHPERKELWNNWHASTWPILWIKKYIEL